MDPSAARRSSRSPRASTAASRPALDRGKLRTQLASPDFYPDQPGTVAVRETHISWVFLAGAKAYKLKKPVVLPFLDYGTPQRRLAMCRTEVRLNRRTAPGIYLRVCAVAERRDGALELAGADDPDAVDYLVEMNRYDERKTIAAKLARGELHVSDVRATARVLERFHARADKVDAGAHGRDDVARRVEENLRELLEVVQPAPELERIVALERFADAFVGAHAAMLAARARDGFVRDVHGDLRAEHVLLNGKPRLLDCVEFDDPLRQIDVAEDLAFLVMDLTAQGGARYARTLLAAYRGCGGDPGESQLVAFYACNRALVRMKVELTRAAQASATAASRGRHGARARELLGVAERFCWQARLPLAITLCGLPAAGKSHLAAALARRSGFALVGSDATRKRLAGIPLSERAPRELYSADWNERTYAELGRVAASHCVREGCGAVIDATFRRRRDRETFSNAFAGCAPVLFVECLAPPALRRERAVARELEPSAGSDASGELVGGGHFQWQPLEEVPAQAHITLRTDRPLTAQLEALCTLLDTRMRALHAGDEGSRGEPGLPRVKPIQPDVA